MSKKRIEPSRMDPSDIPDLSSNKLAVYYVTSEPFYY